MTKDQRRGELRIRERLGEEADVRLTLLSWLQSEILITRSQIERINSQSNCLPSATAADRTKRRPDTSPLKHICCCWICDTEVDLETCNTDEHGMAVHGECDFAKVALTLNQCE